jgi:adenosylcobinamide kinase/adenosylcobinamide-phosphate guanylyltransferase
VIVSNELGMGLVPDEADSRQFREVAGALNRLVAKEADEAYFVVSGIPLRLK